MMDIAIARKNKPTWWRYGLIVAVMGIGILGGRYVWLLMQADYAVARDNIVVDEVQYGDFVVNIRGTGILVPDNVQWLSTDVDATVTRVILKAGHKVKIGDPIAEFDNPQLEQELVEAQWELAALREESAAAEVAQQTNLISKRSEVLREKLNYENANNEFNARARLIETGAVSRLDYDRAKLALDQSQQRWESSQAEIIKLEENLGAQNRARQARIALASKRVERLEERVDGLVVRATIDGTLLEVPLEAGQRIAMGAPVAKLAQRDSLIAELQIPEIQIRDVAIGQAVIVDTRNSTIHGSVSRIDPAVVNGKVLIDVVFNEDLPNDARPDLSVDGVIRVAEIKNTLFVARPLFSQSRSQTALYRLNGDEDFAERTEVEIGLGSVNQIQILKGLSAGDKIVTSDPSRFEQYAKFRIN